MKTKPQQLKQPTKKRLVSKEARPSNSGARPARPARKLRTVSEADIQQIEESLSELRTARNRLAKVGAKQSRAYVARAIKSTEGARNHALRCYRRNVHGLTARGEPVNVLHSINLHHQQEIVGDIFFAVDQEGFGRLHNNQRFFGYTGNWATHKRGQCYRATLYSNNGNARRHRVCQTREGAERALISMARKAFAPPPVTAAALQRTIDQTERKLTNGQKP